jgi:hypothetical protein
MAPSVCSKVGTATEEMDKGMAFPKGGVDCR